MKVVAKNTRANFDYAIETKIVAGVVLSGQEVKSVKTGHVNLKGAYANFDRNDELWLINADIPLYQFAAPDSEYSPTQSRKLLVSKGQVKELKQQKMAGNTIVPLAIGVVGKFVKVEIGVGRGKKKFDKRQSKKKRDSDRKIKTTLG